MRMKRWSVRVAMVVVWGIALMGCGTEPPPSEPATVPLVLEDGWHFADAHGEMILVAAGKYNVRVFEGDLLLTSESGGWQGRLAAEQHPHELSVSGPVVVGVPGEQDGTYFLVLVRPDGTSFEVPGQHSGDRMRGLRRRPAAAKVRAKVKAAVAKTTAVAKSVIAKTAEHKAMLAAWSKDKGAFLRARISDAFKTLEAQYDRTIGTLEATALQAKRTAPPSAAEAEAIIRQSMTTVRVMGEKTPGLKVILESKPAQSYLGGSKPSVLGDAKALTKVCADHGRSIFEKKVKAKLERALVEGFKEVASKAIVAAVTSDDDDGALLTEDELRAVVTGMFTKYIVAQCHDGAKTLDALGSASDKAQSLAQVEHALARARRWEKAKEEFYFEILRAMGHKYLDSRQTGHGGYLIDQAFGLLHMSEGTVEKVAAALAGLIPEVGAAICSALEVAIDAAWNMVVIPTLKTAATGELHDLLDEGVDQVQANIRANRPIANAIKNPVARKLVQAMHDMATERAFQKMLEEHLAEIDAALEAYNGGVLKVAKAASGG